MIRSLHKAFLTTGIFLAGLTAQAATIVDFAWTGGAGYTAAGSFSYNAATTPVSFSEMPGAGPTTYVQSFTISFFDPSHALLETGSSVVNGVSTDRFFRLDYNTSTEAIGSLDGDIGTSSYQYFLTNLRTVDGMVVGPGVTGFNFFYRPNADVALDAASSIRVVSVSQTPEPATLSLLGASGCLTVLVCAVRRRRF